MDMKTVLEELNKAVEPEPIVYDNSKPLPPFSFSEAKDPQGVLMGHSSYVKRSCNTCHGRGYVIQTSKGPRRYQNCTCVNNGYARARKRFEAEMDRARAAYPKATDEEIKNLALAYYLR
jgi:hypothetical protein